MKKKKKALNFGMAVASLFFIIGIFGTISFSTGDAIAGSAVKLFDTTGAPRGIHFWDSGFLGVIASDQTTNPFDFRFSKISNTDMTLAATPVLNSYDILLNTGHELIAGDHISIVEITGTQPDRFYTGTVISMDGNTATLDTPIPFAFTPSLSVLYERDNSLNVDGSDTTQVYSLTNPFPDAVDFTRLIVHILSDSAMDDALFGSLPELTRGVVFRIKTSDGLYYNYWNVKSNAEWSLLGYSPDYSEKAPSGFYGFSVRISYAGLDKHGVAIRVQPGETLQILIQDDLTDLTDLTDFRIMAQGHFTSVEY